MDGSVEEHLRGRFGAPLKHLEVTDSTNAVALAWAAAGAPEGAVVLADEQTAGRGRSGRAWFGGAGRNLLMSVVVRPSLAPARLGLLTIAAGVGIARAVEAIVGQRAALKWPNDVLLSGRKVAGILTETVLVDGDVRAAVVGVGLNTHWTAAEIPPDLAETATSLALELGDRPVPDRAAILAAVLAGMEAAYDLLHAEPSKLLDEARSRSSLLGSRVRVALPDSSSFDGVASAILETGALQVETGGRAIVVHAGDVERVRPV